MVPMLIFGSAWALLLLGVFGCLKKGRGMWQLFSAMMLFMTTCVGASKPMVVEVDTSEPQFRVCLPGNPTTGYQWSVIQYDKTKFELIAHDYIAPKTSRVGAGGQAVFTFSLKKSASYPQKTHMIFRYARAWEPNSATKTAVTIRFFRARR